MMAYFNLLGNTPHNKDWLIKQDNGSDMSEAEALITEVGISSQPDESMISWEEKHGGVIKHVF